MLMLVLVCACQRHHLARQTQASDFWASVWEQRPFVYRSNDDKVSFFRGLCNFDALLDVSSTAEGTHTPFVLLCLLSPASTL